LQVTNGYVEELIERFKNKSIVNVRDLKTELSKRIIIKKGTV